MSFPSYNPIYSIFVEIFHCKKMLKENIGLTRRLTGITVICQLQYKSVHSHCPVLTLLVRVHTVHVWTGTPVIRLEMIRGRMSIFSILMRISPGKETIVRTLLSVTFMYRRSIPNTAPITTPERRGGERNLKAFFSVFLGNWESLKRKSTNKDYHYVLG